VKQSDKPMQVESVVINELLHEGDMDREQLVLSALIDDCLLNPADTGKVDTHTLSDFKRSTNAD
jgi:hypothetical protein